MLEGCRVGERRQQSTLDTCLHPWAARWNTSVHKGTGSDQRTKWPVHQLPPAPPQLIAQVVVSVSYLSAISRRFVSATEITLAKVMASDLSGVNLVALIIDGVNRAGDCHTVALGVEAERVKHPLAVVKGDSEDATLVTDP